SPGAGYPDRRDAPLVHQRRVELDAVVLPRQALGPGPDAEAPGAEVAPEERRLELRPEAGLWPGECPPRGAPLEPVAAQEVGVLLLHVAEPGDVDPVRPPAERGLVLHAGDGAVGPRAEGVVHDVPAQLAAGVA